jgi:hypothetical protein
MTSLEGKVAFDHELREQDVRILETAFRPVAEPAWG